MYIAIQNDMVKGRAEKLSELYVILLRVHITPKGELYVNEKLQGMSYNMGEFTIPEAYRDFFTQCAKKYLPHSMEIFKSL